MISLSGSIDIQHFTIRKQILKKSITVKWQCPEFKGNESYAFKLLRTDSKNGQPSYDADDVVGVFVGDECRTAEVTDADGYAYFTVPGEGKCNLRFLMVKNGDVWLAEATVDFIEDAICGSYKQPLELTFGKITYVGGIAVDADDNARWFDVHGRMLNGKPTAPGVYVRSTYDASTGLTTTRKVVVR